MITNAVLSFVSKTARRQPVSPTRPVPATRPTNMLAVVPSRHPTHRRGRRRAHLPPDPLTRSPSLLRASRLTDSVAVVIVWTQVVGTVSARFDAICTPVCVPQ